MKKIIHVIIAVLIIGISLSCEKFLTVNPKTDVARDELFASESGFKDAMAGVYIRLIDASSYGKALSTGAIEDLVSSWDAVSTSPAGQLGLFNYGHQQVEPILSNIFGYQYQTIANINAILDKIDERKAVFAPGIYEIIKGECLALRAYIHLDLLRLFGPMPANSQVGNKLSYIITLSKVPSPPLDFNSFSTLLLKDLQEAEVLLKGVDPIRSYSLLDFKNGNFKSEDEFMKYRYLRMNYYAVKALQARAYLWFNQPQNAYDAAKSLIITENLGGGKKFRLGESTDFNNEDNVLTCEHIFGLYDFELYSKYRSNSLIKGRDEVVVKNQLYGSTGLDIRELKLWVETKSNYQSDYVFKKYYSPTDGGSLKDFKQIPLLRISEMYLIAVETAGQSEAESLWREFQKARGLDEAYLPTDALQKKKLLIKEYRKEFYGEGQAFYAYKRFDAAEEDIVFVPVEAVVNYLPPLPKIEGTTLN